MLSVANVNEGEEVVNILNHTPY